MIIYIRFRNNFKVGFRSMDNNGYWIYKIHRIDACDSIERRARDLTHTHTFGSINSFDIRIIQIESYTIYNIKFINGVKYLFIMSIDIRIKASLQSFTSWFIFFQKSDWKKRRNNLQAIILKSRSKASYYSCSIISLAQLIAQFVRFSFLLLHSIIISNPFHYNLVLYFPYHSPSCQACSVARQLFQRVIIVDHFLFGHGYLYYWLLFLFDIEPPTVFRFAFEIQWTPCLCCLTALDISTKYRST